jgi:hypothetical protein
MPTVDIQCIVGTFVKEFHLGVLILTTDLNGWNKPHNLDDVNEN